MADLTTYAQWMSDTSSLTSPRSDSLKKLDQAINMGDRLAIKVLFGAWRSEQLSQGKDWRKSVRNGKGAVTKLYRELSNPVGRKLTEKEIEAFKFIADSQKNALKTQFAGKTVQFKSSTVIGIANGAGSMSQKFKAVVGVAQKSQSVGNGILGAVKGGIAIKNTGKDVIIKQKIKEFCQKDLCAGIVNPDDIFKALNLTSVETFASNLAPFVGLISSGGSAIAAWSTVAKAAWSKLKIESSSYAFAPGDPKAAFDSIISLLDREKDKATLKAGIKTGVFTGKALFAMLDAGIISGPILGVLETLAEIFQTIVEYAHDDKQCIAANELLLKGNLNLNLFKTCPILGCYFLTIQDHSTIVNFALGEYCTPNFVFDVESLVKAIQPALDKSREFINASRLEIPGMQGAKGLVEMNYSVKTGLSKITDAPGAIKDKIIDGLIDFLDEKEKGNIPVVDKSRIVSTDSNNSGGFKYESS